MKSKLVVTQILCLCLFIGSLPWSQESFAATTTSTSSPLPAGANVTAQFETKPMPGYEKTGQASMLSLLTGIATSMVAGSLVGARSLHGSFLLSFFLSAYPIIFNPIQPPLKE